MYTRLYLIISALLLTCSTSLFAQTHAADVGDAEIRTRTTDSSLTQSYTGHFGWTLMLPEESIAKYNKIGSKVNEAGQSEVINFMLRGGRGGLTIRYYTEQRMMPLGFALLDSTIHFYDADSVGRNGHIFRRTYVLTDQSIEIEFMLTEKGQTDLGDKVMAIFDSFLPPKQATFELQKWRYGRNPEDYQTGRSAEERSKLLSISPR